MKVRILYRTRKIEAGLLAIPSFQAASSVVILGEIHDYFVDAVTNDDGFSTPCGAAEMGDGDAVACRFTGCKCQPEEEVVDVPMLDSGPNKLQPLLFDDGRGPSRDFPDSQCAAFERSARHSGSSSFDDGVLDEQEDSVGMDGDDASSHDGPDEDPVDEEDVVALVDTEGTRIESLECRGHYSGNMVEYVTARYRALKEAALAGKLVVVVDTVASAKAPWTQGMQRGWAEDGK